MSRHHHSACRQRGYIQSKIQICTPNFMDTVGNDGPNDAASIRIYFSNIQYIKLRFSICRVRAAAKRLHSACGSKSNCNYCRMYGSTENYCRNYLFYQHFNQAVFCFAFVFSLHCQKGTLMPVFLFIGTQINIFGFPRHKILHKY